MDYRYPALLFIGLAGILAVTLPYAVYGSGPDRGYATVDINGTSVEDSNLSSISVTFDSSVDISNITFYDGGMDTDGDGIDARRHLYEHKNGTSVSGDTVTTSFTNYTLGNSTLVVSYTSYDPLATTADLSVNGQSLGTIQFSEQLATGCLDSRVVVMNASGPSTPTQDSSVINTCVVSHTAEFNPRIEAYDEWDSYSDDGDVNEAWAKAYVIRDGSVIEDTGWTDITSTATNPDHTRLDGQDTEVVVFEHTFSDEWYTDGNYSYVAEVASASSTCQNYDSQTCTEWSNYTVTTVDKVRKDFTVISAGDPPSALTTLQDWFADTVDAVIDAIASIFKDNATAAPGPTAPG